MKLSKLQQEIINSKSDKIVVCAAAASGKAQPIDTIIPTPKGDKKLDDIKVGDYVWDRFGHPTEVLGTYNQGTLREYEITLWDGRKAICAGSHLWGVKVSKGANTDKKINNIFNKIVEKTTEEMLCDYKYVEDNIINYKYWIPNLTNKLFFYNEISDGEYYSLVNDEEYEHIREELEYDGSKTVTKLLENDVVAREYANILRRHGHFVKCDDNEIIVYSFRNKYIPIVSIKKLNSFSEMKCLYVKSKDHLYLTNDYIVTHNTTLLTEKVKTLINSGEDKIVAFTFTNAAAQEMIDRIGDYDKDKVSISTVHSYCAKLLLKHGITAAKRAIDKENFDELFELIEQHPKCIEPVNYLIVDEAQDSTEQQYKFFEMINPKHFFYVGDIRQCQPTGTKIIKDDNSIVPIEKLQVGDSIKSIDYENDKYLEVTSKIEAIDKRDVTDESIIEIKTSNNNTLYSNNHICYAVLKNSLLNLLTLYVNNETARLVLFNNCTNSYDKLTKYLYDNNFEKMWILSSNSMDIYSKLDGMALSTFLSLPLYNYNNEIILQQNNEIKNRIEVCNIDIIKTCLSQYNLNYEYPYIEKDNYNVEVRAINLHSNIMCLIEKNNDKYELSEIVSKNIIPYTGTLYSLKTTSGTYIADNILTHNCIYSFAGARPDILKEIMNRDDVTVFDLNENYRNGSHILRFASKILYNTDTPDTSVPMRYIEGTVMEIQWDIDKIVDLINRIGDYRDWAILCRTNQQILDISLELNKRKIPSITFKQGDLTKAELSQKMKENKVKILTMHTSKGLEFNNCVVYGQRFYSQEETRLCYVAATRAKNLLVWTKPETRNNYKIRWRF